MFESPLFAHRVRDSDQIKPHHWVLGQRKRLGLLFEIFSWCSFRSFVFSGHSSGGVFRSSSRFAVAENPANFSVSSLALLSNFGALEAIRKSRKLFSSFSFLFFREFDPQFVAFIADYLSYFVDLVVIADIALVRREGREERRKKGTDNNSLFIRRLFC